MSEHLLNVFLTFCKLYLYYQIVFLDVWFSHLSNQGHVQGKSLDDISWTPTLQQQQPSEGIFWGALKSG